MSGGGAPPPTPAAALPSPKNGLVESNLASVSTEAAITALGQHDQLFHRQVLQLRHQQAAQQQLLQQQFQMQRQLLLDSQEKAMKSHLLEYLDQHRRLEESVAPKKIEKSDVKSRLQEFVLQKKQRESLSNTSQEEMGEVPEAEATDAEVSLLLNSTSYFKALPRISPVQEDETAPRKLSHSNHSPRSCRSLASPWGEVGPGSLGSSSSSLLEDSPRLLPSAYTPSPPRLPRLRPVSSMQYGRTQSAPLPLAHPGLLAPPEVRQGKTSPELDSGAGGSLVKQQIRQSVLSRHHRAQHQPLDPMLAMAELSQMQVGRAPEEAQTKVRHSSTESGGRGRPKPISRTRSSPLVTLGTSISPTGSPGRGRTGVAWDPAMLQHACLCGDGGAHPESPHRLERVLARLAETGLLARCDLVRRVATAEELASCHDEDHVQRLLGGGPGSGLSRLPCGGWGVDTDTVWNDAHTPTAAALAAGSVIDLVHRVAAGSLRNGLGLIRPPGHHAERALALGFCFFNNVAVAARQYRRLFDRRILILDWDIHHGNGTQQEFYNDPEVMYISIHRHDGGNFFPGTGAPEETGAGLGVGTNANIAWSASDNPLADAEYLAAMRAIVLPLIKAFRPSMILVSAGFDAAPGHAPTLGGYNVSPACFGSLTSSLLNQADGKVVLALEGGYTGPGVAESVLHCLRALLGEPCPRDAGLTREELERPPTASAIRDLRATLHHLLQFWPSLAASSPWVSCSHLNYLDHQPMDMQGLNNLRV